MVVTYRDEWYIKMCELICTVVRAMIPKYIKYISWNEIWAFYHSEKCAFQWLRTRQ